jgi:hypothetical protein
MAARKIMVIELIREKQWAVEARTGETFKSWRKAWEYFGGDIYHSRRCAQTKIQRYDDGLAIVQHWGVNYRDATHTCWEHDEDAASEYEEWLREDEEIRRELKEQMATLNARSLSERASRDRALAGDTMSNQGRMTLHMKNKESASGMIGGSERWWPDDRFFRHALALLDRERLWSRTEHVFADEIRAEDGEFSDDDVIGNDSVWGWIEWRRDGREAS